QVREFITEAGKCRDERDQFNHLVRESKERRDEWNAKVAELKGKLNELRPERGEDRDKRGPSVQELKRNLSRMEFEQQTGSLTADKEKALVKAISETAKKLKEMEAEMEADAGQNSDYREALTQFREAKSNAEAAHSEMSKNAELAQAAHEKMISFYDQADRLRKEADGAQAKFIEFKKKSDEEHANFIKSIKSAQETSSEAGAIRDRKASARRRKADSDTKKEAKEIFERFKSGDKLSTEDLMTLQRSGYL
ncbi:MAG: coiled-coil protein, partial [Candidatus Methanomethylophilaceae archaeon]